MWVTQWSALVRKHALVILQSPIMLTLAILGPALAMAIASMVPKVITIKAFEMLHGFDYGGATVPRKVVLPPCNNLAGCKPIYYFTPRDPYHEAIMNNFAHLTSLEMDTDVIGFASSGDIFDTLYKNNKHLKRRAVLFTITFNTFKGNNNPSTFAEATQLLLSMNTTVYTIGTIGWQNNEVFPYSFNVHQERLLASKVALDKAIISIRLFQKHSRSSEHEGRVPTLLSELPAIDIYLAALPSVSADKSSTSKNLNSHAVNASKSTIEEDIQKSSHAISVSVLTTSIMSIGFSPMLLLLSQVFGQEKHQRLFGVLRKLSLFESAYWASVGTIIATAAFISSLCSAITGAMIGSSFYPFGNTHFLLLFLIQLLFAMSFCSFGLLCVAAVSQSYATNIVRLLFISGTTIGIVFLDILGSSGHDYIGASTSKNQWLKMYAVPWKAGLLSLLPFFHYGRIMREIVLYTGQNNLTAFYSLWNATIPLGPFIYATKVDDMLNELNIQSVSSPIKYYAPPAWLNLFIMALLFWAYLLLCCYLNQVVAGNSGGAKSMAFFLEPSYWRSGKFQDHEDERVVLQNLTKRFGKIEAVNNINITMRKGRCLALLGHNGAGKSTLINMLSGLIKPLSGDALIFGRKLSSDISAIRHDLGTCSQDDLHYPMLSGREHLRLYARFKGISNTIIHAYVEERLDLVGLLEHADQLVGKYSGGMKRRLSIVSAGIGRPKFVILDEPTKGMDPTNRRKVWQYIATMKRNCVLLLASHSMEETDILGDEICIIDHGEVRAMGTSLELKNAYGAGYQINLLTWPERRIRLEEFVRESLPQAIITASSMTSMSVIVKHEDIVHLTEFLSILQTTMRLPERHRPVKDWGIQNSSLEQAFMKLTETPKEDSTENNDNIYDDNSNADLSLEQLAVTFALSTQIWAVTVKNFSFQKKQRKTNLIMGLTIIPLLVGMCLTLNSVIASFPVCPQGHENTASINSNYIEDFTTKQALMNLTAEDGFCQVLEAKKRYIALNSLCRPSASFFCDIPDYGAYKQIEFIDYPVIEVWVQGADSEQMHTMTHQNAKTFIPIYNGIEKLCQLLDLDDPPNEFHLIRNVHFTPKHGDIASIAREIQIRIRADTVNSIDICLNRLEKNSLMTESDITNLRHLERVPDYALSFSKHEPSDSTRWFTSTIHYYSRHLNGSSLPYPFVQAPVLIPDNNGHIFCKKLGVALKDGPDILMQKNKSHIGHLPLLHQLDADIFKRPPDLDFGIRHIIGSVMNTYLRSLVGSHESILTDYTEFYPLGHSAVADMVTVAFVLLIMYWLFPLYILVPLMERELKLYTYYQANGLTTTAYWLGNYISNLIFSMPVLVAVVVSVKLYFVTINVGLLLLTVLLGIHSTIALAFLYATVVRSPIVARMLACLVSVVFAAVNTIIVFPDVWGFTIPISTWVYMFPPTALAYGLRLVLENSALSSLTTPFLMMFFIGLACITLAALLSYTSEQLRQGWKYLKGVFKVSLKRETKPMKLESATEVLQHQSLHMDQEISIETKRIDEMIGSGQLAVKIQHLSKRYGKFTAVKNLTLGLEKGECFGLLGPNGSGKTTTVSMLSRTLTPSSGSATVDGFSIVDPRLSSRLGLCPQIDCFVRDLTVEEYLMFFARVRGASTQQAHLYAKHAAASVRLSGAAYTRQAKKLSGGMRRRLSIAIALIGLPPVIILDEPTTGLDPGNRIQIWNIISRIRDRNEHCIILISHLMEEVDALASRIGIMAAGSLRCLGNQVSLKNRFASGYTLYVQVNIECFEAPLEVDIKRLSIIEKEHIDALTKFVHAKASPNAVLHNKMTTTLIDRLMNGDITYDDAHNKITWTICLQYRLPSNIHLGRLFRDMERKGHEIKVVEWTLNQNSLEDVFVQVTSPYVK